MKWTGLNELREQFLSFFESKGHTRLPSYPLVPQGRQEPPAHQLRHGADEKVLPWHGDPAQPPGHHLPEVHPHARHRAASATPPATAPILRCWATSPSAITSRKKPPPGPGNSSPRCWRSRWTSLWVTIYQDDDEAFDIWTKQVGVAPDRIVRLGKEDNFWEHGSGPCGPCSEIYFDRGREVRLRQPHLRPRLRLRPLHGDSGTWCSPSTTATARATIRAVEPKPNIDTGMGLERLACVMQSVGNLFEVDTVQNIMKHISSIAGAHYGESAKEDISLRVITDHIRSTTFMVGDGVVPSNEGRGYVLRRLLRRAARHGRLLGIDHPFLYQVCETVIAENASAYPELVEKKDVYHQGAQGGGRAFLQNHRSGHGNPQQHYG